MIFLIRSSGQLGNRLLISSHAIAYAFAHNETLVDLGFFRYSKYFVKKSPTYKRRIVLIGSLALSKIVTHVLFLSNFWSKFLFGVKLFDDYSVGWVHTELRDVSRNRRILVLKGEGFRDAKNLLNHKGYIKEIFTPNKNYRSEIVSQIEKYRMDGSMLVGIHIRKGDYKFWMEGKYDFQDCVYVDAIRQFTALQSSKQNIKYLLFSDEPIQVENYEGQNIFIGNNSMIVDLYLLSECDFIMGPPSTFSGWASFYGDVPIFHFTSSVFSMELANFKVYEL